MKERLRTCSEQSALLIRRSRYAREVHRVALDHWHHVGSPLRRTAEWVHSRLGRQERWQLWRPLDAPAEREHCCLAAGTVDRWLDKAGQRVQQTLSGQLADVPISRQMGTDGLWARLRGGTERGGAYVAERTTGPCLEIKREPSHATAPVSAFPYWPARQSSSAARPVSCWPAWLGAQIAGATFSTLVPTHGHGVRCHAVA